MFEMKNFVGEDKDIIEVVSSDSAMGALKNAGIKSIRVCLPLLLSFGDLSDLSNYSRESLKELYKIDEYVPFEDGFNFEKEMNLFCRSVNEAKMIRVWSSHLNCDEYCLLLYICSLFSNKVISVVFAEELNWYCKTVGMTVPMEVEELVKREHILNKHQIEDYKDKWNKIITENMPIRHIVNDEVIGTSIDYFDDIILSYLALHDEIKLNSFVGDLMGNSVIGDSGDSLYRYLINHLIDDKKISLRVENEVKYISMIR